MNEIPTWMVLLFGVLCGFVIPSPKEIARMMTGWFVAVFNRIAKRKSEHKQGQK